LHRLPPLNRFRQPPRAGEHRHLLVQVLLRDRDAQRRVDAVDAARFFMTAMYPRSPAIAFSPCAISAMNCSSAEVVQPWRSMWVVGI